MYKPMVAPYYLSEEKCELLNNGQAYMKYPANADGQAIAGKGIFTMFEPKQQNVSTLSMKRVSNVNSSELAKQRLLLKRKAKHTKQRTIKKAANAKVQINTRKEHKKVGEVIMVKVLTSLAPINYRGKTVHLIPQGLTVPAIRTLRGAKLLLSDNRTYEAFIHKFEFGELPNMPVSVTVKGHKGFKGANA
jgi:hypothetical protein